MTESLYKVIELVGTSSKFREKAAVAAITTAVKGLKDPRIAEIIEQGPANQRWQSQRPSGKTEAVVQISGSQNWLYQQEEIAAPVLLFCLG